MKHHEQVFQRSPNQLNNSNELTNALINSNELTNPLIEEWKFYT